MRAAAPVLPPIQRERVDEMIAAAVAAERARLAPAVTLADAVKPGPETARLSDLSDRVRDRLECPICRARWHQDKPPTCAKTCPRRQYEETTK